VTIISSSFLKDRRIRYFASALHQIPSPYVKLDSNRLTLVHFATQALDLLGVWDSPELQSTYKLDKHRIIAWIYSLQLPNGHFQGGSYVGPIIDNNTIDDENNDDTLLLCEYHQGHIAMTYTALCTLKTLGDDWSRVNKEGILKLLPVLQREDGSFQCTTKPSEHDMRFLYCACAISYMLQDWSGMDTELCVQYVQSCRAYDGAIALIPGQVRRSLVSYSDRRTRCLEWLL
jgi:geranylgeranyl transferase type-1 subunit beta